MDNPFFIEKGYIVLSRELITSRLWHLSPQDITLAITCLLYANYKSKFWFTGTKNILIKRGSFVSSFSHLISILPKKPYKYTRQNLRTCINHLEKLQFLTNESTNHFSLITIINYNKYQNKENYLTNESTNAQPTPNQRLTTTNKGNKGKKDKKKDFKDKDKDKAINAIQEKKQIIQQKKQGKLLNNEKISIVKAYKNKSKGPIHSKVKDLIKKIGEKQ